MPGFPTTVRRDELLEPGRRELEAHQAAYPPLGMPSEQERAALAAHLAAYPRLDESVIRPEAPPAEHPGAAELRAYISGFPPLGESRLDAEGFPAGAAEVSRALDPYGRRLGAPSAPSAAREQPDEAPQAVPADRQTDPYGGDTERPAEQVGDDVPDRFHLPRTPLTLPANQTAAVTGLGPPSPRAVLDPAIARTVAETAAGATRIRTNLPAIPAGLVRGSIPDAAGALAQTGLGAAELFSPLNLPGNVIAEDLRQAGAPDLFAEGAGFGANFALQGGPRAVKALGTGAVRAARALPAAVDTSLPALLRAAAGSPSRAEVLSGQVGMLGGAGAGAATGPEDQTWQERARRAAFGAVAGGLAGAGATRLPGQVRQLGIALGGLGGLGEQAPQMRFRDAVAVFDPATGRVINAQAGEFEHWDILTRLRLQGQEPALPVRLSISRRDKLIDAAADYRGQWGPTSWRAAAGRTVDYLRDAVAKTGQDPGEWRVNLHSPEGEDWFGRLGDGLEGLRQSGRAQSAGTFGIVGAGAAPEFPQPRTLRQAAAYGQMLRGAARVAQAGEAAPDLAAGMRARQATHLGERAAAVRSALEARYQSWEQAQDRLVELETRLAALTEGGAGAVERPPWARPQGKGQRSMTEAELVDVAERSGVNPYASGWWQAVDPATVRLYRQEVVSATTGTTQVGKTPAQLREAGTALRREVRGQRAEVKRIERAIDRDLRWVSRTEAGAEGFAAEAGRVSALPPPPPSPLKRAAERAAAQDTPTLTDRTIAVAMNNVLSGPRTLAVNLFSGGLETLNRPLLELLEGRPREAISDVAAMGRALGTAWAHASEAFLEGGELARVGTAAAEKLRPEAFAGRQGALATPALRFMGASDQFIKTLNAAGALAVGKLRGLMEDDAVDFAERAARRAVLQGEGQGSPIAQALMGLRARVHEAGAANKATGIAFYVLTPFIRIPEEILTRGVRMTLSPATDLVGAGVHALRRDPDAARAALARWQLNTALAVGIYSQVEAGNLTGMGPRDARRRAILEEARDAAGNPVWRPHAVRIGGRWYDYTGLGPLAVPMAAIASGYEAWHERGQKPDSTVAEALRDAAGQTGRVVLDASYLRTVGKVFKSLAEGRVDRALADVLTGAATAAVPFGGLLATAAGALDEEVREPRNLGEAVAARVPGLRELVPERISPTTGEPLRRPQDLLSLLSPMRTEAPGAPNPVAAEVARLEAAGHPVDVRQFGRSPVEYAGARQSEAQRRELQETFGRLTKQYVAERLRSPAYAAMTDEQKARTLNAALAGASQWANLELGERVRRDPRSAYELARLSYPRFEGVSSRGSVDQVRWENFRIAEARNKLAEYRRVFGRTAGEARLAREDREAFRLAHRQPLDPDYLRIRDARAAREAGYTPVRGEVGAGNTPVGAGTPYGSIVPPARFVAPGAGP